MKIFFTLVIIIICAGYFSLERYCNNKYRFDYGSVFLGYKKEEYKSCKTFGIYKAKEIDSTFSLPD